MYYSPDEDGYSGQVDIHGNMYDAGIEENYERAGRSYSMIYDVVASDSEDDIDGYNANNFLDSSESEEEQEETVSLHRNWNAEYQHLLHQPESKEKYDKLGELMRSFVQTAEQYGRLIISERNIPHKEKVIQPVNIGGIAGGDKFIVHGILFKFALDPQLKSGGFLYGGAAECQELAMKAAKHELNNLIAFNEAKEITKETLPDDAEELCTPLMALIDYYGYRLVATTLLPLGKLIYGTDDGGKTIHNDNAIINRSVKHVLQNGLRLKEHLVNKTPLCGPADLEVHQGKDGRFYVLDFARLLPPEAPNAYPKNSVYYYMLRKELLRSEHCTKQLNSDSFANFGSRDPHFREDNQNIRDLNTKTFDDLIPEFGASLLLENPALVSEPLGKWLCNAVHAAGLNLRHLGRIRHALLHLLSTTKEGKQKEFGTRWEAILLQETTGRAIAQLIRMKMRVIQERAHSSGSLSVEVSQLLNRILESNQTILHTIVELIQSKFQLTLSDSEVTIFESGLCWYQIDLQELFERISALSHISFSSRIIESLQQGNKGLQAQNFKELPIHLLDKPSSIASFLPSDLISFQAKLWKSDLMERCTGVQALHELHTKLKIARQKVRIKRLPIIPAPEFHQVLSLIDNALKSFSTGLKASPTSPVLHYLMSLTCLQACWVYLEHSLYSAPTLRALKSLTFESRIEKAKKYALIGQRHANCCIVLVPQGEIFHRISLIKCLFDIITDGIVCPKSQNPHEWGSGSNDRTLLINLLSHAKYCFPYKVSKDLPMDILFPCLLQQSEIALHVGEIYKAYSLLYMSHMMFSVSILVERGDKTRDRAIYGLAISLLLGYSISNDTQKRVRLCKITDALCSEIFTEHDKTDDEASMCWKVACLLNQITDSSVLAKLKKLIDDSFLYYDSYCVRTDLLVRCALNDRTGSFYRLVNERASTVVALHHPYVLGPASDIALEYIISLGNLTSVTLKSTAGFPVNNFIQLLQCPSLRYFSSSATHWRTPEELSQIAPVVSNALLHLESLALKADNTAWEKLLHVSTPQQWEHLKQLKIFEPVKTKNLQQILQRSPTLQKLELLGRQKLDGNEFFDALQQHARTLNYLAISGNFHTSCKDNLFADEELWSNLSELRTLHFLQCDLTKEDFLSLFSSVRCPVEVLRITHGGYAVDDSVVSVNNLKLKEISFIQTNAVTELGWCDLFKRTPSLTSISLFSHFRHVTDAVVDTILQTCQVRTLDIGGCSKITGNSWLLPQTKLPSFDTLTSIDISSLRLVPGGLEALSNFVNLNEIKITNGTVNSTELLKLVTTSKGLKKLYLSNCSSGVVEQIIRRSCLDQLNLNQPDLSSDITSVIVEKKIRSLSPTLPNSAMHVLLNEVPCFQIF